MVHSCIGGGFFQHTKSQQSRFIPNRYRFNKRTSGKYAISHRASASALNFSTDRIRNPGFENPFRRGGGNSEKEITLFQTFDGGASISIDDVS